MPTYEFRCSNGHVFEQLHKISDAPTTATCAQCGVVAERVISGGAGLVFKGSGFYLTDYGKNAHRTSGPATAAKGDGDGGSKGESKSETKSESKSDAKPASGGSSGSSSAASSSASPSSGGGKSGE
jgi:putative FmdB family regulatory protein